MVVKGRTHAGEQRPGTGLDDLGYALGQVEFDGSDDRCRSMSYGVHDMFGALAVDAGEGKKDVAMLAEPAVVGQAGDFTCVGGVTDGQFLERFHAVHAIIRLSFLLCWFL